MYVGQTRISGSRCAIMWFSGLRFYHFALLSFSFLPKLSPWIPRNIRVGTFDSQCDRFFLAATVFLNSIAFAPSLYFPHLFFLFHPKYTFFSYSLFLFQISPPLFQTFNLLIQMDSTQKLNKIEMDRFKKKLKLKWICYGLINFQRSNLYRFPLSERILQENRIGLFPQIAK